MSVVQYNSNVSVVVMCDIHDMNIYRDIYHFDTSDQREKPVYKSHIAHLSV